MKQNQAGQLFTSHLVICPHVDLTSSVPIFQIYFLNDKYYIQSLSYASQGPAQRWKRVGFSPVEIRRARGQSNPRRPRDDGEKCDLGVEFRSFHTFIMLSIIPNILSRVLLFDQTYYAPFIIRSDSLRRIKFLPSGIKTVVKMPPPVQYSNISTHSIIQLGQGRMGVFLSTVILSTWDNGWGLAEFPLLTSAKGKMFGVIGLCFSYVLNHSLDGPNARIGWAQMQHSFL